MKALTTVLLLSAALGTTAVRAQSAAAPAPIPAAILHAKTIFLSNGGADAGLFPSPFSGDPSRAYQEFYLQLQSSGRFQLVSEPAQADLVLELQLQAPYGPSNPNKQQGASDPRPQFRLTIYDRQTHFVLWTLTEAIDYALLQKTHDRNFDAALDLLAREFEALIGPAHGAPSP